MSAASETPAGAPGGRLRLPPWLAPRDEERRGRGEQRLVETLVLVLVGLVLAVATIHDLSRSVGIGDRLASDLETWRAIEGVKYHNPLIEQDIKTYTTRDIVCANRAEGKPEGTVQVCLVFTGPVLHGDRRAAHGGWYLVAAGKDEHEPVLNYREYRYGCFGTAIAEDACAWTKPPPGAPAGAPTEPLHGGY
jgi:hypothetical protein